MTIIYIVSALVVVLLLYFLLNRFKTNKKQTDNQETEVKHETDSETPIESPVVHKKEETDLPESPEIEFGERPEISRYNKWLNPPNGFIEMEHGVVDDEPKQPLQKEKYFTLMNSIAFTNSGSRPSNQDTYFEGENLFIVCDGVGGAAYGDVASKLACNSFADYFKNNQSNIYGYAFLNEALKYTISNFQETENQHPEMKGMATTIVLVNFDKFGAIVAWLGDSRLYHIRNGEILFVTEDHSLINDLRKQGNTDEEKLKNIRSYITKSLSAKTETEFSFQEIESAKIQKGDYFFLCTDGVRENITDEILCNELNTQNSLEQKAQKIFSLCEGKTRDNFTFQIIEI